MLVRRQVAKASATAAVRSTVHVGTKGMVTVREAALRLACISLLFATLYAACNHITHRRGDFATGVFEWEQGIPFVPWTVVPYLSIFGFFVASFVVQRHRQTLDRYCAALVLNLLLALACYACVPLRFTFERQVPAGLFGPLFELLHAVDLPYNRAPSLHISVLLLLWWRLQPLLGAIGRKLVGGWFLLIALSVLTTYQHHVIDIPAGVAAAWFSRWLALSLVAARTMKGRPARIHLPLSDAGVRRCQMPTAIG